MGGQGSGGQRIGAGRKAKSRVLKVLHGTASLSERKAAAKQAEQESKPAQLLEGVPEPPADMLPDQRTVWCELAPTAVSERTLTAGTLTAFRDLCEAVALKRLMFAEIMADGLTGTKVTLQMDEAGGGLQTVEKKAHTLLSRYTTMMQRVEAGMLRFRLSPMGKPVIEDKPAEVDPFAAFEVVQGGKS